ncbi:MAG TPA: GNAT family N-acetyltransferase [Xanthomonadaceae bacterium]|nr:GNAT family N-acetyltransferase [Xanthomonadaceae bacterium]
MTLDPRWTTPPVLEGAYVRLEPLSPAHADGLRAATEDGRLWELWFTSVPAPEEVDGWIAMALAMQAAGDALAFAVLDAGGRVVGSTRYYDLSPATPRVQVGHTWYARSVQRTGLNGDAKLLLLGYAFEVLGCVSVGFQTSTANLASRAAIARLGASLEGITRHHQRHRDGSLRDTANYSIIASEWSTVKAALQRDLADRRHD